MEIKNGLVNVLPKKNKVCDLEILDSEFWEFQNVHKSGVFTCFLVCSPLFWEEDSYFQVQPLKNWNGHAQNYARMSHAGMFGR